MSAIEPRDVDALPLFVSGNGLAVYGVEPPRHRVRLTKETVEAEPATSLSTRTGDEVVLFGVDEAARWRVTQV